MIGKRCNTREFKGVARQRFKKGAGGKVIWDHRTPAIEELKQLAENLRSNAVALSGRLGDLWEHDDEVLRWRHKRGFA